MKQTQFRIYTEDLQRELVAKVVGEQFDGFSLFRGVGYWKGTPEHCLCIEILAEDAHLARLKVGMIANAIKVLNKQESVLVTEVEVEVKFI